MPWEADAKYSLGRRTRWPYLYNQIRSRGGRVDAVAIGTMISDARPRRRFDSIDARAALMRSVGSPDSARSSGDRHEQSRSNWRIRRRSRFP